MLLRLLSLAREPLRPEAFAVGVKYPLGLAIFAHRLLGIGPARRIAGAALFGCQNPRGTV